MNYLTDIAEKRFKESCEATNSNDSHMYGEVCDIAIDVINKLREI